MKNEVVITKKKSNNKIKLSKVFKRIGNLVSEFMNKSFGKVKGKHIVGGILLVIVLVLGILGISSLSNKVVDYPVIYNNSIGNLLLLDANSKDNDPIKLSSSDNTSSVKYANTTDKYVLFKKNNALFLYNEKSKDNTTKILNDVLDYEFSLNDKYIVATNTESTLYIAPVGKDKVKIEDEIKLFRVSENNVLYVKGTDLYVRDVNPKKDKNTKITDEYSNGVKFSNDGSKIFYVDTNGSLRVYDISKKKDTKIDDDIDYYYASDDGDKLYYKVYDDEGTIYYYDGKNNTKIVSDVILQSVNVDSKYIIYSQENNGKEELYFKNGEKEAYLIEKDIDIIQTIYILDNYIYYQNGDNELKVVKVKGNKTTKAKTVVKDVSSVTKYEDGLAVIAKVDNESSGTLYKISKDDSKKIDTNVYNSYVKTSEDGKKVYYLKDYSSTSGKLYVLSGNKTKEIETDVYKYEVANSSHIFMIRGYSTSSGKGDLYINSGKKGKTTKIAEEVTRIASIPSQYDAR